MELTIFPGREAEAVGRSVIYCCILNRGGSISFLTIDHRALIQIAIGIEIFHEKIRDRKN
jgi:hypothetical protein